jgi:hypothetical protein
MAPPSTRHLLAEARPLVAVMALWDVAVARLYDEPVLTANGRDFEAFGIDVETY